MAVYPIDNQAFDLSGEEAIYCRNGKPYYQFFPRTGCTEFEMRLTPETDVELFSNPYFEELESNPDGWNWDLANVDNNQVILFPQGYIEQQITGLTIGAYYRVCVEILAITPPQALVVIGSGSLGFNSNNAFNTVGIHCVYFIATDADVTFVFGSTGGVGNITLGSASVKEISIPIPTIETCEGTPVGGIDFTIDTYKDIAKIGICWEQLQPNCFKLCVTPAPETANDLFTGANLITTEDGRSITVDYVAAGVGSARNFLTWTP
jgi:hypothetical protein